MAKNVNSPQFRSSCNGLMCSVLILPISGMASLAIAEEDGPSSALPPITVTGEKVGRPYLETFTSVGIVTSEDLDNYDISDTSDAYKRMANVRAFSQNSGSKSISIRGLEADGITEPQNAAGLISVIVDGVTQSPEGLKRGSRGLWDVEQLEVFRGPQSTTQGRNALAGTVVIKTKDPTFVPEANVKALYGQLDREELAAAVSAPIVEDQLAFRLSGEFAEKTADVSFDDPGIEQFAEDEYRNLRGKLLYQPENLEQLNVLLTISDVYDSPASYSVTGPDFYARRSESASTYAEAREMSLQNYSVDASWDNGNGTVFRSVTGYNDTDLEISSVPASTVFARDEHREDGDFQQEFRMEINEKTVGITGVAGLYYATFEQDVETYFEYFTPTGASTYLQQGTRSNETETVALYADLRYHFTDQFNLVFGGRYQNDDVRSTINLDTNFGATNTDSGTDYDVFLPKLGVAMTLTDSQTVALTATKGYRQGFAQVRLTTNEVTDVDPEFVWNYEMAYRFAPLNNNLILGLNLFYNDYTDQQVTVVDPIAPSAAYTVNAGQSESYGAEVEVQHAFDNGLSLYAALGLLHTELGNFDSVSCDGGSCEGLEYPQAPEVTASLGGLYKHASGFFASLSGSYTGDYFSKAYGDNLTEAQALIIDDSVVFDTKIGYEFSQVTVSLYIDNLLDEDYLTGMYSPDEAVVGDGRAAGVELVALF